MRLPSKTIMRAIAMLSIAPAEAPPVIADVARPWAGIVEIASQKTGYLNGYRGSRAQRAGYRRYRDGYWYPPAAFGAPVAVQRSYNSEPFCDKGFRPSSDSRPPRCPRY
jgi:hypothetical protein